MQTADGLLLHGAVGEKLVNHYSFYAAFTSPEEFRLVYGNKNLGTLPLSQPVEQDSYLIFAGKRWRVQDLDMEKKLIQIAPARGGKVPMFNGNSGLVDNGVREEMRRVLAGTEPIRFLDTTAVELLKEAQSTFYRLGLDKEWIVFNDNNALLSRGTRFYNPVLNVFRR